MLSSGMLRRVALVIINVSEECIASIIRVTRIDELGTLAISSKRSTLRRNTTRCYIIRATPATGDCHATATNETSLVTGVARIMQPQVVFLGSVLRFLLTANVVHSSPILVILMMEAIRSYETSILARPTRRNFPEDGILHSVAYKVAIWTRKWRMKLNESKSVHIDFTNNKIKQQPVFINGTKVPYANTAKYLGMNLDAKLR
jgi:hypothetical protein